MAASPAWHRISGARTAPYPAGSRGVGDGFTHSERSIVHAAGYVCDQAMKK